MPKMGLMPMKLLEFCQEVIILKYKNFLAHPFVPLCSGAFSEDFVRTSMDKQNKDASRKLTYF